jgi:hypothetical protein
MLSGCCQSVRPWLSFLGCGESFPYVAEAANRVIPITGVSETVWCSADSVVRTGTYQAQHDSHQLKLELRLKRVRLDGGHGEPELPKRVGPREFDHPPSGGGG